MNGAESLIRTAVAAGVGVCFANPGTTEMPLVAALDSAPGMRAVLALFEGVCTGAADGYARMSGKPAMTLLHLGPGLANGLANLHNARRANTPLVNVVGDHATWHAFADAPLASDIVSLASPMSGWVRSGQVGARARGRHGRCNRRIAQAAGSGGDADRPLRLPVGSGRERGDAAGSRPARGGGRADDRADRGIFAAQATAYAAAWRRSTVREGSARCGAGWRGEWMQVDGRNIRRANRARRGNSVARASALFSRAGNQSADRQRICRAGGYEGSGRVFRLSGYPKPPRSRGLRARNARAAGGRYRGRARRSRARSWRAGRGPGACRQTVPPCRVGNSTRRASAQRSQRFSPRARSSSMRARRPAVHTARWRPARGCTRAWRSPEVR